MIKIFSALLSLLLWVSPVWAQGNVPPGTNTTPTGSGGGGSTIIAVTTQSGTTYTLASSDCGSLINFTNASAVTVTIPATLPLGCNIAFLQAGAGKVSVNGSAVTPATLQVYGGTATGSAGQWATIGISIQSNVGGSAAVAVLQGNAS